MRTAPRVLVADDDARLRALLTELLREDFGTQFGAVADGVAAVAALAAHAYTLLVLDLGMPRADGFAAFRCIGQQPPTEGCRSAVAASLGAASPPRRSPGQRATVNRIRIASGPRTVPNRDPQRRSLGGILV
jgi:CheY-like chemotaxis protein